MQGAPKLSEVFSLDVSVPIATTARTLQLSSMFDIPASERSTVHWDVHMPLGAQEWKVGLIVGPSGSGKSTIARHLFGDAVITGYDWPKDHSVIDAFPASMSIRDVSALLGAVGFNTPPSWMRPYHVLSTGEQFRVTIARALSDTRSLVCIDEFTSVVDRQVAQIASHSVQKAVRRTENKQLVALSCHYDIIDWLQPDWIYEPQLDNFQWRSLRRRLDGSAERPNLDFSVYAVDRGTWRLFAQHHYLSRELSGSAQCFGGYINGKLVAFNSYLHLPHPVNKKIKIGHRLVVLPDYQGIGIGGIFEDWLGEYLYSKGYEYHNVVAHPALLHYFAQSPRWERHRTGRGVPTGKTSTENLRKHNLRMSIRRVSSTFVYKPARSNANERTST